MNTMMRWHIINDLIKKYNYKSYLEIGTQRGVCFEQIGIQHKDCVDVEKLYAKLTHTMTSDDFFKQNTKTYDIIFIDGNHEEEYVTRDIDNAVKILNKGGTILCHDCCPFEENMLYWGKHNNYTGTVFRSFIKARKKYPELNMFVIDTDWGVGIITNAHNSFKKDLILNTDDLSYQTFTTNKKDFLNLITVNEFSNWMAT